MIKNFYTKDELRTLLNVNFYSILYYNSELWHITSLNPNSKQHLLSASPNALRHSDITNFPNRSFVDLHRLNKGAKPTQMSTYKHALLLFKLYKSNEQSDD